MTMLQNGDRKISVKFNTTSEIEVKTISPKETTYTVALPTVICNNEEDSHKIQTTINKFVSNLVKNIIENKE